MSLSKKTTLNDYKTAHARALFLLARREHSAQELTTKLIQKGFSADIVANVLDNLQEKKWQSDQRFCESYIHSYAAKGHGPLKIRYRLKEAGVAKAIIETAFSEANIDWQINLQIVYNKYFNSTIHTLEDKLKQQRFLMSRGFELTQIQAVLNSKAH